MISSDMASHNPERVCTKKGQVTSVHEVLVVQTSFPSATTLPSILYSGHFLSHEESRGFFSQNVQGINYNPPKKVSTVLKHYFYFVHRGGPLYGKAVGVELRTT